MEPLKLVRQIGENKWRHGEEYLQDHPELEEILVQSANDWLFFLRRNNDGSFTRITHYINDNKDRNFCSKSKEIFTQKVVR